MLCMAWPSLSSRVKPGRCPRHLHGWPVVGTSPWAMANTLEIAPRSKSKQVSMDYISHDDIIKWKQFPRYWPFVRGIHRWPVNSPHKGQWRRALMFYLICARINGWINNREAGGLGRHCAHYDVIVNEIRVPRKGIWFPFWFAVITMKTVWKDDQLCSMCASGNWVQVMIWITDNLLNGPLRITCC